MPFVARPITAMSCFVILVSFWLRCFSLRTTTFYREETFHRHTALNVYQSRLSVDFVRALALFRQFKPAVITNNRDRPLLSDKLVPITNRRYGRLQICATRPHCALHTVYVLDQD